MGMFDYIKCEMPLPDTGQPDISGNMQTKSFECHMDTYRITASGRMVRDYFERELTPQSEKPYPDAPESDIRHFAGIFRRRPGSEEEIDLNYHGYVYFDNYKAKFTDGQCVEITVDEE